MVPLSIFAGKNISGQRNDRPIIVTKLALIYKNLRNARTDLKKNYIKKPSKPQNK